MLTEQINGFIEYCKVSGFSDRSIQALTIRLNDFNDFLKSKRFSHIQNLTYRHLSTFVADYKNPSIHVKKSRIWSLKQLGSVGVGPNCVIDIQRILSKK